MKTIFKGLHPQTIIALCAFVASLGFIFNLQLAPVKAQQGRLEKEMQKVQNRLEKEMQKGQDRLEKEMQKGQDRLEKKIDLILALKESKQK